MKLLFTPKKYHCENGHYFKIYKVENGSKHCPKCGTTLIYKKI